MRGLASLLAVFMLISCGGPTSSARDTWTKDDVVLAWNHHGMKAEVTGENHLDTLFHAGDRQIRAYAIRAGDNQHFLIVFSNPQERELFTISEVSRGPSYRYRITGPDGWEVETEFNAEPAFQSRDNLLAIVQGQPSWFTERMQQVLAGMGKK